MAPQDPRSRRTGRRLLIRDFGPLAAGRGGAGRVPGPLHRGDQLRHRHRGRRGDPRGRGGIVHRRADLVQLVQLLLDPHRARRAGHPLDGQADLPGRGGPRSAGSGPELGRRSVGFRCGRHATASAPPPAAAPPSAVAPFRAVRASARSLLLAVDAGNGRRCRRAAAREVRRAVRGRGGIASRHRHRHRDRAGALPRRGRRPRRCPPTCGSSWPARSAAARPRWRPGAVPRRRPESARRSSR